MSPSSRARLRAKLAELVLLANAPPGGRRRSQRPPYEDEDGRVEIFPLSGLSDAAEDSVEMAVAERAAQIFEETGLAGPGTAPPAGPAALATAGFTAALGGCFNGCHGRGVATGSVRQPG
jgi:hypothetical protein